MSNTAPATTPSGPPAGWYDDPDDSGRQRWSNGTAWTEHIQSLTPAHPNMPVHPTGPVTVSKVNLKREVVYNREQKGHSILKHVIGGIFVLWINVIYIVPSPNHYWHA